MSQAITDLTPAAAHVNGTPAAAIVAIPPAADEPTPMRTAMGRALRDRIAAEDATAAPAKEATKPAPAAKAKPAQAPAPQPTRPATPPREEPTAPAAAAEHRPAQPSKQERRYARLRSHARHRGPITAADAALLCPSQAEALAIAARHGLDPVDMAQVEADTRAAVLALADALRGPVDDYGMARHMAALAEAHVVAAFYTGKSYAEAVSKAHRATSPNLNDDRDEDRDLSGRDRGYDSDPEAARDFAARVGLRAAAVQAAASGALAAHEEVTGEAWKPRERRAAAAPRASLARAAAAEQLAAFGYEG